MSLPGFGAELSLYGDRPAFRVRGVLGAAGGGSSVEPALWNWWGCAIGYVIAGVVGCILLGWEGEAR